MPDNRILVDTHVLVYAYDRSELIKQQQALAVLHPLAVTGLGVLSTQILSEFFVAVTQKIAAPLTVSEARERVRNYLQSWQVVEVTGLIVLEATRGVQEYQFSFWDALVWATARLNQVPVLFSEDFNPGQVTEGIVFVNPFAADFQLETWLVR